MDRLVKVATSNNATAPHTRFCRCAYLKDFGEGKAIKSGPAPLLLDRRCHSEMPGYGFALYEQRTLLLGLTCAALSCAPRRLPEP